MKPKTLVLLALALGAPCTGAGTAWLRLRRAHDLSGNVIRFPLVDVARLVDRCFRLNVGPAHRRVLHRDGTRGESVEGRIRGAGLLVMVARAGPQWSRTPLRQETQHCLVPDPSLQHPHPFG